MRFYLNNKSICRYYYTLTTGNCADKKFIKFVKKRTISYRLKGLDIYLYMGQNTDEAVIKKSKKRTGNEDYFTEGAL